MIIGARFIWVMCAKAALTCRLAKCCKGERGCQPVVDLVSIHESADELQAMMLQDYGADTAGEDKTAEE